MEPKFNTSFIPKKTDSSANGLLVRGSGSFNIFDTLATILFVLTLLSLGGLFVYRYVLGNQITAASKEVDNARASFEVEKIQSLVDANSRIVSAKSLLEKHVTSSALLAFLQDLTVKKIRFSALSYADKGTDLFVSISVESQSYNALADQSEVFSRQKVVKNVSVSDFSLADNGLVKAKISLTLNPDLVSYKKSMDSLSLNQ